MNERPGPAIFAFGSGQPLLRTAYGLCLGYFDGVHRGHRELLRRLVQTCREENCCPAVYTFDTLPKLTAGTKPIKLLQSQEERWETLREYGVEEIFCQAFTEAFAKLEGPAFLQGLIDSGLVVRVIVVGYDFRYGSKMHWGIEDLRVWCDQQQIRLIVVEPVRLGQEIVHSRGIREALERGDCAAVTRLLGHPFVVRGRVESGQALGRRLGFPTANLTLGEDRMLPPPGVYRSWTQVGSRGYWSLSSLGYRPTVERQNPVFRLETYLYDFAGSLYGEEIAVSLVERMREERVFESLAALQEQVQSDLQVGRQVSPGQERLWLWDRMGEVPVYLLPTDRFRRGVARIQVRAPLDAQAADRALAWNYVCEATQAYPTRELLEKQLNHLYGGMLEGPVYKSGAIQVLELDVQGLLEAPEGVDRPFEELLELAFQMLCEPVQLEESEAEGYRRVWDRRRMDLLRENALDELDSEQNDRGLMAWNEAMRRVFADQPYGRLAVGERGDVAGVTAESARAAYFRLLQEGDWAVYLAVPPDPRYLECLRPGLEAMLALRNADPLRSSWTEILRHPPMPNFLCSNEVQRRCVSDLEQSRWVSLWRIVVPPHSLQSYAARLLNELLGGEAHSLLFEEIREQRGLAYSIDSFCLTDRMLWAVQAGIHPGHEEEAMEACRQVLKGLQENNLDPMLLRRARALIGMQLRVVRDDVRRMLRFYQQQQIHGDSFTPENLLELYEGIDVKMLAELARSLEPCLEYWLVGEMVGQVAEGGEREDV